MPAGALDDALFDEIVAARRDLHRHPELSWQEHRTSKQIGAFLERHGIAPRYGTAETGIVAEIPGVTDGPYVALRADIDALPITEETGLPFASVNDGCMHACGHDAHSAMLLGASVLLARGAPPPAPIRLIFQPAEELGAGALAMIDAGMLDDVAVIFGGHVDRHFPAGAIAVTDGPVNASTDTFRIHVHGQSAHAARPHEGVDAIVVGMLVVSAIQTIVSREVNPAHPAVVTVGCFHAGTAANVLAGEAILEGTVRAQEPVVREHMLDAVARMAKAAGQLHGAGVDFDLTAHTPAVVNPPDTTAMARQAALDVVGSDRVRRLEIANMGAEDFGHYMQKIPGCYVRFGSVVPGREGYPAHSSRFDVDEEALRVGAEYLHAVALRAATQVAGLPRRAVGMNTRSTDHGDFPAVIREARENDAPAIRDIMLATYGDSYPHIQFYDVDFLRKMIMGDDALNLVAECPGGGGLIGTASVIVEIGAYSDLVGEFGRLAVLPEWRGRGIGRQLMAARLARVRDRLHVGIVDARVFHPFSQMIAQSHGFVPVGFAPLKEAFRTRESTAVLAQWFGEALALRRNNPRIIREVYPIAAASMANAGLDLDVVVDDSAAPYPHDRDYQIKDLTTQGYSMLLRIERGRMRAREIFGPMRLHYGFFKLRASHAEYMVARRDARVAGAIGYIRDEEEKIVRIFELITPAADAVQFLLSEVERRCREAWGTAYVEVDVRADAPRMQRTLVELGFMPTGYIPALVFHEVERHDVVRMARVYVPVELDPHVLTPETQAIADIVVEPLRAQQVLPEIDPVAHRSQLLRGLTEEQVARIAAHCSIRRIVSGAHLFSCNEPGDELFLVLEGDVDIAVPEARGHVGSVGAGEALGETGLLGNGRHTVTATARTDVRVAIIAHADLETLIRRRPDIGVVIYRNLAQGLGHKLRRTDQARVG